VNNAARKEATPTDHAFADVFGDLDAAELLADIMGAEGDSA